MARIRTAIVGCGSVSGPYLEDLSRCPYVELVSVADIVPERAAARAAEFHIPHHFPNVDSLLAGPEFDFLINLTSMPSHYEVNRKGLQAGKHVLSEKPLAGSRKEGRELLELAQKQGVQFYGAPIVVTSPAFRHMVEVLGSGRIGQVFQVSGRYGHGGPSWGAWFYRKGGGALFDLGVYNITFLTGLLGPVRSVSALMGTAIRERMVEGEVVEAEADDNTLVLMDHGKTVYSTVATGFVYGRQREDRTIEVIGTRGGMNLLGWDWQPEGVEVWSEEASDWVVECRDQQGYDWQRGGSLVAESLATGKSLLMTPEHAYHVLDVMLAAHESAASGQRVAIESRFSWPLIASEAVCKPFDAPVGLDPVNHAR